MKPVPQSQDYPVADPPNQMTLSNEESSDEAMEKETEDMEFQPICSSREPHLLSQGDLNDLVLDLNLSKKQS